MKMLKYRLEKNDDLYVDANSLLEAIDDARDNGNLIQEKGFSAALFLSELIKELETVTGKR